MIGIGHSLHTCGAGHGLAGFHASFTSSSLSLTSPATKFVDGVAVVIFTILKQKFYCAWCFSLPHSFVENTQLTVKGIRLPQHKQVGTANIDWVTIKTRLFGNNLL